jgi:hypothetical protein
MTTIFAMLNDSYPAHHANLADLIDPIYSVKSTRAAADARVLDERIEARLSKRRLDKDIGDKVAPLPNDFSNRIHNGLSCLSCINCLSCLHVLSFGSFVSLTASVCPGARGDG